jgi:hypothetical protein
MPEPFDAKRAALELTSYIRDVFSPPPGGAPLGSVLGAHVFKSILKSAGYAIVPLKPTSLMQSAFYTGSFRTFETRYEALVKAAWPEEEPDADSRR